MNKKNALSGSRTAKSSLIETAQIQSAVHIPGHKIGRLVAEGGMASVYLAEQVSLGRHVAIKILKRSDNPSFSQRFLDEGRIIAALNHKNIITIHDIGVINDCHYISMEYVEGGDLEAKIASGMKDREALDLLENIGNCLDFVHRHGVIHRDIKPGNILFRTDGTPLLTDFGIAKQLDATNRNLTMDGLAVGSPYYFSPEQAQGRKVDGRTDIYGLGVIFFEILTGNKPFVGKSPIDTIVLHLQEPIPTLPKKFKRYQSLLNRMMAKKPAERFKNAAMMVKAIKEIRLDSGKTSKQKISSQKIPKKIEEKKQKAKKRRGLPILFFILISLVPGFMYFSDSPSSIMGFWKEKQEIKKLLALGTERYTQKKLSVPKDDSALFYYSQVLKLDSDNAAARSGITDLAIRYAEMAEKVIKRSDYEQAGEYLKRGLSIEPTNKRLLGLKNQITKYRNNIKHSLALASHRFKKDQLVVPKEDSALFYYTQVLKQDSNNAAARSGITSIANRYAEMMETVIKRSDYAKAERYLKRGLDIEPSNKKLLILKRKIVKNQQAIKRFLASASRQFKKDRLMLPKNDSALFYYSKVLKLDSKNAAARRGVTSIANRYAEMAGKAMKLNKNTSAWQYLKRGLSIQPANKRLRAIRTKLKNR